MALIDLRTNLANWPGTFPVKPSEANPAPVNFFDAGGADALTGARGFTKNFNTIYQSKFINLNFADQSYNYPVTVKNGRLMQPSLATKFPGPQNYFNDISSGAKGFSLNFTDSNQSKFIGISNSTYTYPQTVKDGRLMKPLSSVKFPGPQNFFNNNTSGARGFTLNVPAERSEFIGVSNSQEVFNYPKTVPGIHKNSVSEVPTKNSKFDSGIAKFNQQLGYGSKFFYVKDRFALVSKIFSEFGYDSTKRYSDKVQSIPGQLLNSLLATKATERNSPSAIDEQYKKFNLQDESFNPFYIRQPYVLRGIQRKNSVDPQRWGINSLADDGTIRAGIAAATERSTADLARITQWLASPKGLLWSSKQVGLGLSNPKVETATLIPIGQTRIHSGASILASIPTTAFGLHFTRHGIPFANEVASYEKVQLAKQITYSELANLPTTNRLLQLRSELFQKPLTTLTTLTANLPQLAGSVLSNKALQSTSKLLKGIPIASLSGPAGPNSAYGIGLTNIRRVVDTRIDSELNAFNSGFVPLYNIRKQYASFESLSTKKSRLDTNNNDSIDVDNSKETNADERDSLKTKISKYTSKTANIDPEITKTPGSDVRSIGGTTGRDNDFIEKSDFGIGDIRNYETIAYNKIPKNKSEKIDLKGDFRNLIDDSTTNQSFLGKRDTDYFQNYNLETRYGFGTLGKVGEDRTTAPNFIRKKGTEFTGKASNRKILASDRNFRGDRITATDINTEGTLSTDEVRKDKDLIKFYFQDGDQGRNVMLFRCTINGFNDSFVPGWDRVEILGRPEGAYLYSSFERSISFNFSVAALTRSEMIPMWRKLNYLASYTMPDYGGGQKPSGPFMRITIGDLFQETPGFIESLSYTVPDECTWDIAEDADENPDAKQLPMMVDVSMTFKIIADYKPQMIGRVYSLSPKGTKRNTEGQWLLDART